MPTDEQRIEQEQAPPVDPAAPSAPSPDEVPQGAAAVAPESEDAIEASDAQRADEPEPEPDLADLRERAAKADGYLALAQRTQADFENFRKRMTRDVRAAEARGVGRLAKELFPALDSLERAVATLDSSDEDLHLAEGFRLVTAELSAALGRVGIQSFTTKGERFDPVHHEAVAQTPVQGTEPGTIVEVLQSGYRLNESVLRPARVIVAG